MSQPPTEKKAASVASAFYFTTDMPVAFEFFRDILGMEPKGSLGDLEDLRYVELDTFPIIFLQKTGVVPSDDAGFGIAVSDLEATYELAFGEDNYQVDKIFEVSPGLKGFTVIPRGGQELVIHEYEG